MKLKLSITTGLIALIATATFMFTAKPADCAFCATYPCFQSNVCGTNCVCLKQGMDLQGQCYSANLQDNLINDYGMELLK